MPWQMPYADTTLQTSYANSLDKSLKFALSSSVFRQDPVWFWFWQLRVLEGLALQHISNELNVVVCNLQCQYCLH